MNALRIALLAIGGLFAVAAAGAVCGIIASLSKGEGPSTAVDWLGVILVEVVLLLIAAGLFRAARAIGRRPGLLGDASAHADDSEALLCPECCADSFVQGHIKSGLLFGRTYIARCRSCAHRAEVSRAEWLQLPLPEDGDALETWDDKRHRTGRLPMTPVQILFVLAGLIGFFAVVFLAFDNVDTTMLSWAVAIVAGGCWWLGRLASRSKRSRE